MESILKYTHPLKISTAMEILYGDSSFITSGMELLFHLQHGLDENFFTEFLMVTKKGH